MKFIADLVWWFRVRTTLQYHVLHLFDEPGFAEVDEMLEAAIYKICKHYLENELMSEKSVPAKHRASWSYYRGYRLHGVNDKKNIDACLSLIEFYEKWNEKPPKKATTVDKRKFYAEKIAWQEANAKEYTKRLNKIITIRGALWT